MRPPGARGAARRVPPSHTQVRLGSGPGSTPPAAAALHDPPLRAPHSVLRVPRTGHRSCPARDKGAAGRSLRASGAWAAGAAVALFARPAGSAILAGSWDSEAQRLPGAGDAGGAATAGRGRGRSWHPHPAPPTRPKHRLQPALPLPAPGPPAKVGEGGAVAQALGWRLSVRCTWTQAGSLSGRVMRLLHLVRD